MTTIPEVQKGTAFRPSKLVNDTRYRGYTLQVVALIATIAFFAWLASNAATNLDALGIDISFDFLGDTASYDINQTLIAYSNRDTHLRAAFVGVLNTLLVAFLGCVTATILGVLAGVLRLSRNWIVARLMAVYVEAFRNVPILIWILIIFSIMTVSLPAPSAFRGENPDSSLVLGLIAFTNRGVYFPAPVLHPGAWAVIASFLVSIGAIYAWRRYTLRTLYAEGRVLPGMPVYLALFFLPTLLVYFLLGRPVGLDIPALAGFNFQGGIQVRGSLLALWFALGIYTGAFIAENVRAGIQSVSRGQTEAAASLGLRAGRITRLVVLPQALRVIVPPVISQYLNLTKNSSLAIAVGYMDVTGTLGGITLNQTGRAIECVLLLMLFYLVISLCISAAGNLYNRSVNLKER